MQLLFDVNKAVNCNDIIIFVEKFDVINKRYSNLSFGKDNTYIILNNKENKEILRKINNINVHDLVENLYEKEILISDWDKADYLLEDERYILYMPFFNSEKIAKIYWYYQENTESNRKLEILTLEQNKGKIQEILENKCNIRIFDKDLLGGGCEG